MVLIAAVAASACSVSRTFAPSEIPQSASDRARTLKLFLANGDTMTLARAQIVGDTVSGFNPRAERVAVPLGQIYSLRLREIDPGLTLVSAALVVAAVTALSYVLMAAAYSGS